jgi:hypothetical protein
MSKIKHLVDGLQTMAFVGFDKVETVSINSMPMEISDFPDGKGGRWKKLIVEEEDVDCCQYKAKKGHVFRNHIHQNVEIAICIGKFKIETPFRKFIVDKNGTYKIDPKIPHRVTWLTDGSLIIVFSPKFGNGKEWEADVDLTDEN